MRCLGNRRGIALLCRTQSVYPRHLLLLHLDRPLELPSLPASNSHNCLMSAPVLHTRMVRSALTVASLTPRMDVHERDHLDVGINVYDFAFNS